MRKLHLSQNLIFSSLNTISVRWRCLSQMMLSQSDDAISVRWCCHSQLYISRSDDAVYLSWLSVPISSQHTTAEISNSVDFHNKFFFPLKRPRKGKNCFTVKICWQKKYRFTKFSPSGHFQSFLSTNLPNSYLSIMLVKEADEGKATRPARITLLGNKEILTTKCKVVFP